MGRKSLEQKHEELAKSLHRGEVQRMARYKGYSENDLIIQLGYDRDILTINQSDSRKEIKAKVQALEDVMSGSRKMVQIPNVTKQNRWLSERAIKQADRIQSQRNYENFILSKGIAQAGQYYKVKNDKGVLTYRKADYLSHPLGLDIPVLPSLTQAQTFTFRGTDIKIGMRIPSHIKRDKNLKQQYQDYLFDLRKVEHHEMTSSKQTLGYKRLFGKGEYKYDRYNRLAQYKKSFIKASTGSKSVLYNNKAFKNQRLRIKKKLEKMSSKDFLYLNMRYPEMFEISYMYKYEDYQGKYDLLESTIDNLQRIKQSKDESSIEYQSYKRTMDILGSYYG